MAIPTTGLVAHYTMDSISTGFAIDAIGGFDLTNFGTTLGVGVIAGALHFDGSTRLTSATALPIDGIEFAFSLFVKPDVIESNFFLHLGIITSSGHQGVFAGITASGAVKLQFFSGGWVVMTTVDNVVTAGHFSHIVIQKSTAGFYEIYVDKVLLASEAHGIAAINSEKLTVGALNQGTYTLFFEGSVDQLRLYSNALTLTEIESLYEEQTPSKILPGTITETLGVIDWHVRSYRVDNGALTASVSTNNGTFELAVGVTNDVPHLITCSPEQGTPWVAEEVLIVNQLRYPTNPSTIPYYYKVTIAGTAGVTEPTWVTVPGQTVVDGTVTWECVERLVQPITHSPIIPQ